MGKYVDFDAKRYAHDLREALVRELRNMETQIYTLLVRNFSALPIRKVDMKYKADMVSSIRAATHLLASDFVQISLRAGGETRPNQSFRVIYYEYGIGTKMQPPPGWSPGDEYWNPARPPRVGERIYQRPRGYWYDLGGNVHYSNTKGKPKPLPNVPGKIGEEIEPHFWFHKSVWEGTGNINNYILNAVKSIPINSYIKIRSIKKVI